MEKRWRHYSVTALNGETVPPERMGELAVQIFADPGEKIRASGYFLEFLSGNESSTSEDPASADVSLPVRSSNLSVQSDGSEIFEAVLNTAAGAQFRAHVWAVIEPA